MADTEKVPAEGVNLYGGPAKPSLVPTLPPGDRVLAEFAMVERGGQWNRGQVDLICPATLYEIPLSDRVRIAAELHRFADAIMLISQPGSILKEP